ncbi:hypothetical protein HYX16_03410 [Candidatus Woesearchaeota archaeon]|nr:hypothetical protein [Candidatus Woesearchaeota archaeon]
MTSLSEKIYFTVGIITLASGIYLYNPFNLIEPKHEEEGSLEKLSNSETLYKFYGGFLIGTGAAVLASTQISMKSKHDYLGRPKKK